MNYRRLKGKQILICVYAAAHTNTRKTEPAAWILPGSWQFRAAGYSRSSAGKRIYFHHGTTDPARVCQDPGKRKRLLYISCPAIHARQNNLTSAEKSAEEQNRQKSARLFIFMRPRTITRNNVGIL